jgi:hypothetical protein
LDSDDFDLEDLEFGLNSLNVEFTDDVEEDELY